MTPYTSGELVIGALYGTGALLLLIAAYVLYIRKVRNRGRFEAANQIRFETSLNNIFTVKTQFLITFTAQEHARLDLLNENEEYIKTLLDEDLSEGEHIVDFNPAEFDAGKYYLSLKTQTTSILRKITISEKV